MEQSDENTLAFQKKRIDNLEAKVDKIELNTANFPNLLDQIQKLIASSEERLQQQQDATVSNAESILRVNKDNKSYDKEIKNIKIHEAAQETVIDQLQNAEAIEQEELKNFEQQTVNAFNNVNDTATSAKESTIITHDDTLQLYNMIQDLQSQLKNMNINQPTISSQSTINNIKKYLPEIMLENAINQQLSLITRGQTNLDSMHKILLTNKLELTDTSKNRLSKYQIIQETLLHHAIPLAEWKGNIITLCIPFSLRNQLNSAKTYNEFLEKIFTTFNFNEQKETIKQNITNFTSSNTSMLSHFATWIQLAKAYPFVDESVPLIRTSMIEVAKQNGFTSFIDNINQCFTLNDLYSFVTSKFPSIPFTINQTKTSISLNKISNKSPLKYKQHLKNNKKRITFWCRNCNCSSCALQKKRYNSRKKFTQSAHYNQKFKGIQHSFDDNEQDDIFEFLDHCPQFFQITDESQELMSDSDNEDSEDENNYLTTQLQQLTDNNTQARPSYSPSTENLQQNQ